MDIKQVKNREFQCSYSIKESREKDMKKGETIVLQVWDEFFKSLTLVFHADLWLERNNYSSPNVIISTISSRHNEYIYIYIVRIEKYLHACGINILHLLFISTEIEQ